ncbi:MAG: putative C-S lyase [Pseudonocardiaceae bacterium]|nr:putative C-S lyase [Pseudonocardiaceae bacterium]
MIGSPDFDELDYSWLRAKHGVKWQRPGPDLLPAWVADMDFPVAPPIRAALGDVMERGDLGYPDWSERSPLAEPFARRMRERYSWAARPDRVRDFSDLIQILQVVLWLTTRPGDAVALHTPNYPPFLRTITRMGRRTIACPFELSAQGWVFDPHRLERAVARAGCRTLLLVNPHNPTGRVLTAEELHAVADIVLRHDMLVIADEIHADLTFPPHRHIPLASLGPEIAERTVTVTSATKTFNIAGLRCAVAHIGPASLRDELDEHPPDLFGAANVLGVAATTAAWQHGDDWLAALLERLRANRDMVASTLARRVPAIEHRPPQATYLSWLDCRALGIEGEPARYFRDRARVELSPGSEFGDEGIGFARLNFATSPNVLTEILDRLATATHL